jgi:hypothetical protein
VVSLKECEPLQSGVRRLFLLLPTHFDWWTVAAVVSC